MKIQKNIFIIIFSLYLISSFVQWQETTYYWENNIFLNQNFIWIETNKSDVWFRYWWNNFWWLFFIKNIESLTNPESVQLWSQTKICKKKINGIYYNNQRWMRFRPLDINSLNTLKNIPWNYDDTQLSWWFFTDCESYPSNRIYWNITHTVWWYNYELIAWVELNFGWNTYFNFWWILNLPRLWQALSLTPTHNWIFLSWHIFDNYWWIWMVRWSWNCVDIWQVDPNNICSWEVFIQYSNCGNIKTDIWKKNCDEQHQSAWVFCKYSDEQYIDRWIFTDTKTHRWLNYIEIMRKSCLHRWKETNKWLWTYYPDDYIKKSEVIKTLVKIMWIAFNDFQIESEDKEYPFNIIFEDVQKDNRFSWYTSYAFNIGLTDWLYKSVNNKKYLSPDDYLNRYDTVKKLIETYNAINWWTIKLNNKTNLTDLKTTDPYYNYIRQAESLWIIIWYKQKDGTYRFEWNRNITRAEFAKIVSMPFALLLLWY